MSFIPPLPALTLPANVPPEALDRAWRMYHEKLQADGCPPELSAIVLEALKNHGWQKDKSMRPDLYRHMRRCLAEVQQ